MLRCARAGRDGDLMSAFIADKNVRDTGFNNACNDLRCDEKLVKRKNAGVSWIDSAYMANNLSDTCEHAKQGHNPLICRASDFVQEDARRGGGNRSEKLAIFGPDRSRRGAELKAGQQSRQTNKQKQTILETHINPLTVSFLTIWHLVLSDIRFANCPDRTAIISKKHTRLYNGERTNRKDQGWQTSRLIGPFSEDNLGLSQLVDPLLSGHFLAPYITLTILG